MTEQALDTDIINELIQVMGTEFATLVESFLRDSEQRLQLLGQAIQGDEAETVRELAHSFKGSSSNLGATELSALCRSLEQAGRDGALDEAREILEQARDVFERTRRQLNDVVEAEQ